MRGRNQIARRTFRPTEHFGDHAMINGAHFLLYSKIPEADHKKAAPKRAGSMAAKPRKAVAKSAARKPTKETTRAAKS